MSNIASIEAMEAPKNQTQLLLKTHTSTDGSVSPKPRWSRGVPPTFEEDAAATSHKSAKEESATPTTTAATSDAEDEEEAPPSPPSLRSGGRSNVSSTASKSYVAWRWLVEDEADTEPRLNKPAADDSPLVLPELLEGERELLCRHVELRLREVDRQSDDISALVDEYLRFMWLRQRLESMLTLDPSPLVDDVWQAHITLESDYAGFCERTFGGERLDQGVPHREIDPSQPVLYENTVGAYEHFFGACPPAEFWPEVPTAAAGPALDGEETGGADFSGRRKAFVRSAEEHFRFSEE